MTYSPGGQGYPPAQQPTTQFAAPTQQFGKVPETSTSATDKLPLYLTAAVAALGLAVYLASFGPYFIASVGADLFTPIPLYLGVVAAVLAGLFAGVALLPKQTAANAAIAALSVLGFLLVLGIVITVPDGVSMDWGLYLIIAFTALQAIVAVGVLLLDSGLVNPPAPRPKYEQQQYGQYSGQGGPGGPGPYYGQQPHRGGQPQHHGPQHQRPGYPSQYGGGYPGGPSTGGYSAQVPQGPPTPPTGFPAYGQPQHQQQSSSSAPTTQVPAQPQSSSQQSGQSSSSSSQQSGKSSS